MKQGFEANLGIIYKNYGGGIYNRNILQINACNIQKAGTLQASQQRDDTQTHRS
jgi:hypothetical protein